MLNKLTNIYHEHLLNNSTAMSYLKSRGIYRGAIRFFKLGFCSNNIGYNTLAKPNTECNMFDGNKDKFNDRIIFPIMFNGNTEHFTSRAIGKSSKPHLHQEGKINLLYNHDAVSCSTVTIVESPIDAVTLQQANIPSVATMGMGGNLKRNIGDFYDKTIYIAYDKDPNNAGQTGALRVGDILERANIESKIIEFHGDNKMDVNLFFQTNDRQDFIDLMENAVSYTDTDHYRNRKKVTESYFHDNYDITIVAKLFGLDLIPMSQGYKMICPFHQDSAPSLVLYTQTNTFYCFSVGCHRTGDAFELYRLLKWNEGIQMSRAQAKKALCADT